MPFIVFYSTQLCYKGYWLPLVKEICCSFIQAALNALSWKKIKEFRGFFLLLPLLDLYKMEGFWSSTDVHHVAAPPSTEGHRCDLSLSLTQLLANFVLPEALGEIRIQV